MIFPKEEGRWKLLLITGESPHLNLQFIDFISVGALSFSSQDSRDNLPFSLDLLIIGLSPSSFSWIMVRVLLIEIQGLGRKCYHHKALLTTLSI